MKISLITISTAIMLLVSCQSDSKKEIARGGSSDTSQQATESRKSDRGAEAIMTAYLDLKNALVKDDDKAAAEAGKQLAASFKEINTSGMKEAELKAFEDIREDAIDHASHISRNVGNISHQREHFETLSEDIYDLKKAVRGDQKLYYLHCPMYNEGKGANWVSETKEVQNPYLGKSMPECGTLKEEL
ncbi:hypothetical protein BCY91_06500 [Pelobium manganitolerans]|uniref:DUF3347 domain-containing protein n=1 Tax=Pelobium manganitolerans TaxID=1842495 RepID=A0A419S4Y1_9SPHI|nr:DUF3347 domain-containing protein [Pelobium manganitolerans]RKD15166.1 hypothetical protein BCY91_06500 [Pelobium manganitolerans]